MELTVRCMTVMLSTVIETDEGVGHSAGAIASKQGQCTKFVNPITGDAVEHMPPGYWLEIVPPCNPFLY